MAMPRHFVAVTALLTLITCCTCALAADRPNVILMMADDLGWGDTGYNGHPVLKTPNLDEMAAHSLRFDRFYSAAPVCSPTRGSCITGRHPERYGIHFANVGHMKSEEFTLAEALKPLGYTTGHFGKWHLGTLTTEIKDANRGKPGDATHFSPPWVNGFDNCFSTESKVPTWDPMIKPKGAKGGTWWDPIGANDDPAAHEAYGTHYWTNGKRVTDNLRGDDSKLIMDRAIPFIEHAVKDEQPFFAVIWFHAPHLPVVAGPKYAAMYAGPGIDKHSQHYYGCITALDEQVGRLRRTLRDLGVAENTMLWFCSDNGPEGNADSPGTTGGLRGRKRSLFEGGVRVPGLIEWPARIKSPRRTSVPAVTSDYMPTVLAALGYKPEHPVMPIDGINLMPLIDGTMTERPTPIAFESRGTVTLTDNRYKLVVQNVGAAGDGKQTKNAAKPMLFDLIEDETETTDIAARHPDIVARMTATLRAWRRSCQDSLAGKDYQ